MRTFACFTTERGSCTPTLSFILAETEQRARELARRELMDARQPLSIELCEGGKVLWAKQVAPG
jgi:hypothetical protein